MPPSMGSPRSDRVGVVYAVQGLSAWSQKFYNGTFHWIAEGFTDDQGGPYSHILVVYN